MKLKRIYKLLKNFGSNKTKKIINFNTKKINKMKTTENNKLIAEFINLNFYKSFWYKSNIATEKQICKENNLQFHSDWNLLIEVVEKIESLGYRIEIVKHICRIYLSNKETIIISENTPKIEAVYNAVVEFIKWYNNQNKVS